MSTWKPSRVALAALGGAGVLALGIAVPAVALAEDGPSASPSASSPAQSDREQRHQERQQKLIEGLAKELGIPQERVAEALTKVQDEMRSQAIAEHLEQLKARLGQAVSAGKITQEQADAILKAAEAGVVPGFGGHGGFGGHDGFGR